MSSITTQQAKLDLKLVPMEKRLEIGKCNGRLNTGKTQREPTFQVVMDALALTPCYFAFLTTIDVPKKDSPSKKDINLNLVPVDEEPKSAKKKVPAMKTTRKQSSGVVLRDNHVVSVSKKKEKVIEYKGKGIETHPSDSSKVTKIPPSAAKIKPSVINEGISAKPRVPNVTEEESTENDEEEKEDEFVQTPSNYTPTNDEDETNIESKVNDNAEGDEDKGMDYTTNQIDNDVNGMLNDPVHQGNENLEITLDQVIEDAHVTISIIAKKTEVLVTSSSHSSDLASKFLNFVDIPYADVEIVSPMDVHVHHEVPSSQTPTLLIVPDMVITESSLVYTTAIPQSLPSLTRPPPLSTPLPPPTIEATNHLSTLLDFGSVF
nr:hypothetical protein [Tanacetum cinerariifolium]